MKNFFAVAFLVAAIFVCGCGGDKTAENPAPKVEKPVVPVNVIQEKLKELSAGFDVRVDNMKEVTYYHCPQYDDDYQTLWVTPYVVVDKNYNASLHQDILYVGRRALYFDKLYIKTSSGVETFQYPKTVSSVSRNFVGEEYSGVMTDALYKKLQAVIDEGGAKFRLEGRSFAEREFEPREIANMKKAFEIYELLNSVDVEK